MTVEIHLNIVVFYPGHYLTHRDPHSFITFLLLVASSLGGPAEVTVTPCNITQRLS